MVVFYKALNIILISKKKKKNNWIKYSIYNVKLENIYNSLQYILVFYIKFSIYINEQIHKIEHFEKIFLCTVILNILCEPVKISWN